MVDPLAVPLLTRVVDEMSQLVLNLLPEVVFPLEIGLELWMIVVRCTPNVARSNCSHSWGGGCPRGRDGDKDESCIERSCGP